ncbi:RHS repeat-associated core domain-containing protein [Lysobacter sp. ESA13C]|uniref:RHS repeat domain-containing protein n=1 Tax=Lysobacter sp. ESA13C TaxID=2862676 RepID=UPI001CBE9B16|nr:RHS repeat-associated core domain-containing protein [Lysobacter sp. ESA13C]
MKWISNLVAAALLSFASLGVQAETVVEYIHTDALGSPVAVTDVNQNVVERSEYEPYGVLLNRPMQDGPGYTGHVSDAATGLSYMQQRYYDPSIGVFLSTDPVTVNSVTAWNFCRYCYAGNNPYKFRDADGRIIVLAEVAVPAAIVGAAIVFTWQASTTPEQKEQQARAVVQFIRNLTQRNESSETKPEPGTAESDEGCIYCVDGQKTRSGKPYVGSADDLEKRAKTAKDGRDRSGAEKIGSYPKGDRTRRQDAEQKGMNERGGKEALDNRRDEVAAGKWDDRGIPHIRDPGKNNE